MLPMPSWLCEPTTHVTGSKGTNDGSKLFRDGMSGLSSLLSGVHSGPLPPPSHMQTNQMSQGRGMHFVPAIPLARHPL